VPGATVNVLDTFENTFDRWIDAEARCDAAALDALLDIDFRGDGPRGFVLTKDQWLDRYRHDDLVNSAFEWEATDIRFHGGTAFVRGIQTQKAFYRGEDCSGRFQATLVARRDGSRWSIVNLQLSELGTPESDGYRP